MLVQLPRPTIPSVSCETMDIVHHPQEMLSSLKTAVRSEFLTKEQTAFDLQIPILFYLRDSTCVFFRSRRGRSPGKWVKSFPCFLSGSKTIGEAQRLWLQSLIIHLERPVAHPHCALCRISPTPAAHLLQQPPIPPRVAEAAREPSWELSLRFWRCTSFEAKMWLRIALPYSHSLETQLQQGVCEALGVWKCIAEWARFVKHSQPVQKFQPCSVALI